MMRYQLVLMFILASSHTASYCNLFKFTLGDHELEASLQEATHVSTHSIVESIRKELAACLHLSENYFTPEIIDFEIFSFDKGILFDDQDREITVKALLSIDQEIETEEKGRHMGLVITNKKLNTIIAGLIFLKDAFLEEWFRFSQNALLPEWIQFAQTHFDDTVYFARNIEDEADKFCSTLNSRCPIKLNVLFTRESS